MPNKERGTFHIEKGNYWKFYNLEFVYLDSGHADTTNIMPG